MSATAFASSRSLDDAELAQAPIRYPRPSGLARRLRVEGTKAQAAAETLGLLTIGDLLEHLPRDHREARSVSQLVAGETATVVVEVRSIASRPVRRRGMRPLVEATVGRRQRVDEGDVLPAAVARPQVPGGYAAGAARQVRGPRPLPRAGPRPHHRGGGRRGRRRGRPLPGDRGAVLDPDPDPRARSRGRARRRRRTAARADAGRRAAARAPGRAGRHALRVQTTSRRRDGGGWPSRSCCSCSWPCCAAAGCAATARSPRCSTARPS